MEVKSIYWDRANINIELNSVLKEALLVDQNNNKIKLEIKEKNIITISITNFPEGFCLKSGKYYIIVDTKTLKLKSELIKYLDDYSRNFKYEDNFYACIVNFDIDDNKTLYIDIDYMMKNRKYNRKYRIIEGKNIKEKIIILFKIMFVFLANIFYKTIRFFAFFYKKNILFLSENSDVINDNLKKVYDKLKDEKRIKKYRLRINVFNKYQKQSIFKYIKEIIDIAVSDTIIIDNYVSILNILSVSKSQKIIQLWHAGVGFKAVGYARFGLEGGPHPVCSGHRKYTYAIVDDEKLIEIYKEVFGIAKDKLLPLGMPRLDDYLSLERIKQISNNMFRQNKKLKNKKIILFSPTYRGKNRENAYYDYDKIDLKKVYDFCIKNNFMFIIKMHLFINNKIFIPKEYSDIILDYSSYNINNLIYITDIMITDYSSCAYEYSFFDRPIIFYRYDKDLYEHIRGIHTLDVFTTKQFEVLNFDDLMKALNDLKEIDIKNRFKKLNNNKRKSCDYLIDMILGD